MTGAHFHLTLQATEVAAENVDNDINDCDDDLQKDGVVSYAHGEEMQGQPHHHHHSENSHNNLPNRTADG